MMFILHLGICSMVPLMILPALLLAAKPAAAIGKDPRQMARE